MTHARNAPLNREKCWEKGRGLCSSKLLSLRGAPDSSSGVTERHAQPHESRSEQNTRGARPGTDVTLTDACLGLHTNGVVARESCLISAEQILFVTGADHLLSAFAHLADPRQWSRAPTRNLKGSGAKSGSCAYCGLKPPAGFDRCNLWLFFNYYYFSGLMTNMELPGRCVLFAALLMSVPLPVRSGQCFTHVIVNYSPSRCDQNKLSGCQPNRDSCVWRTGCYGEKEMGMIWICKTKPNFAYPYTPNIQMWLNPTNLQIDSATLEY